MDGRDVDAEIEEIARRLERRIEGVLSGEITEPPSGAGDDPSVASGGFDLPPGEPDVSAMALALADLPAGFVVEFEGYVAPDGSVATYERDFAITADVRIGDSQFDGFFSRVVLFDSAEEARFALAMFEGEQGAELMAQPGPQGAELLETDMLMVALLGDRAVGWRLTLDSPVGAQDALWLLFQLDRTLAMLLTRGERGHAHIDDLVPLARAVAKNIRASLDAGSENKAPETRSP